MARHAAHHAHTLAFQRMFPNYREGQDTMNTLPSTTGLPQKMRGFTLIEIAIVLVIVGLLLGGVLKGQEFIENARANRVAADIQAVRAAVVTYVDRYGDLPGFDTGASRFSGLSAEGVPNTRPVELGKAPLENLFQTGVNDTSGAGRFFWLHLRASGLLTGCTDVIGDPANNPCVKGPVTPYGTAFIASSRKHCSLVRPNKIEVGLRSALVAERIDRRLDDGRPYAGDIMSSPMTETGNHTCATGAPDASTRYPVDGPEAGSQRFSFTF